MGLDDNDDPDKKRSGNKTKSPRREVGDGTSGSRPRHKPASGKNPGGHRDAATRAKGAGARFGKSGESGQGRTDGTGKHRFDRTRTDRSQPESTRPDRHRADRPRFDKSSSGKSGSDRRGIEGPRREGVGGNHDAQPRPGNANSRGGKSGDRGPGGGDSHRSGSSGRGNFKRSSAGYNRSDRPGQDGPRGDNPRGDGSGRGQRRDHRTERANDGHSDRNVGQRTDRQVSGERGFQSRRRDDRRDVRGARAPHDRPDDRAYGRNAERGKPPGDTPGDSPVARFRPGKDALPTARRRDSELQGIERKKPGNKSGETRPARFRPGLKRPGEVNRVGDRGGVAGRSHGKHGDRRNDRPSGRPDARFDDKSDSRSGDKFGGRQEHRGSGDRKSSRRVFGDRGPARDQHSGRRPAEDAGTDVTARSLAASIVDQVMRRGQTVEESFARALAPGTPGSALDRRDRAFARLLATTALRRHGEINTVLLKFLDLGIPEHSGPFGAIMRVAIAQLLFLGTPPHAAIDQAVSAVKLDGRSRRFGALANAVLRKVVLEGPAVLAELDALALNVPEWLTDRWGQTYGPEQARAIADASLQTPSLDLSPAGDGAELAGQLGGALLASGSVRLVQGGRVEALEGYDDGAWWVQDAAAALPAKLLGDVAGQRVADICAAPGGKTAQLCAGGAQVTALDSSLNRLERLKTNMKRLGFDPALVLDDAITWSPAPGMRFDAILVDAPCSATGTIRRHPDILHRKEPSDFAALTKLQAAILRNAARLVEPGGRIVFCTCSLEPEEGEGQISAFLASHPDYQVEPVVPGECGIKADWITPEGFVRTLPFHVPLVVAEPPVAVSPGATDAAGETDGNDVAAIASAGGDAPVASGMDGFFIARLRRDDRAEAPD